MREKDVNLPCRIFAILVMLFLLAPLVVIVIASFTPTALITFPPQGFSLKWYANIFGSSTHFMDGLVNSLKIGILATAADILLGVTAALSVCRYSFKGKDALLNYYTSPMYVPSVAFAFVLLQVYSQIGGVPGMLRIFIGHLIMMDAAYFKHTLCHRTGFIKYHIFCLRQGLQIVRPLNQNTCFTCTADARKET